MLPEGEFYMLRDLYRQGLSISEIARQTGYNRRTVSKYVNAKVPPVSRKPSAKPSNLDDVPSYIVIRELIRKISRDSHLSYNGNRYSVPYIYAGREARVQIERDRIGIFVGLEKVCEHETLTGSHRISRNKEHFRGLLSEIIK
jgi:hypothetical protein